MIDNLEKVLPFLQFDSEDDFYYLQILQRKKENAHIGSNSRVIKNYYITSQQYLLDKWDEIKVLCDVFNARASIRLNKRSFEKVGFKCLENIANTMQNREYNHLMKSYDRACGLLNNEKTKRWIVDVDEEDVIWIPQIIDSFQACQPFGDKLLARIPSKSGIHLITTPFNVTEFKEYFTNNLREYQMSYIELDIHRDNPTNIYIP